MNLLNFKINGSTDILPTLNLVGVHVVFDKTTFESVQARLGGMFNEVGDAANTSKWLCYYQRHTSMPWVIWLVGGEINGNRVGGFRRQ